MAKSARKTARKAAGTKAARKKHTLHHKDGSIHAKGSTRDGAMDGYWEWFRKDGTRMRTGSFEMGQRIGDWTTYDRTGAVVKVTRF